MTRQERVRDARNRVDLYLDQGTTLHRLQENLRFVNRGQWATPAGILFTLLVVLPSADLRFTERRAFMTGQQWTVVLSIMIAAVAVWLIVEVARRRSRISVTELLDRLCEPDRDNDQTPHDPPHEASTPVQAINVSTPVVGQTVRHQEYGSGRVTSVQETELGPELTVDFPAPVGRQTLLARYLSNTD